MNTLTKGTELIADERQKQIDKHGFTAEHHVNHPEWYNRNQLLYAAMHLSKPVIDFEWLPDNWDKVWFKNLTERPHKERLIIAGALIAAELDRLSELEK